MIQELYTHFLKHPIVCTDTRELKSGALFFALKGGNFNANEFAEKALNAGCSLAIIDEEMYKKDERYFLVDDVLSTLQALANYHRKQLDIPIIAITGSNGKTTSKELVNVVLSQKFFTLATKGNLNNHIGVPLTLLNINPKHEIAIVEMGANHQGEIAELCAIAEPNYAMITNIGKAHLEGFGGYEGVIKAKSEMYTYIQKKGGCLFVNADNELLNKLSKEIKRVTYGRSKDFDFVGEFIESNPFVKLKYKSKEDPISIEEKPEVITHLIGEYNFENILAAACIGSHFNVSEQSIKKGLESYVPSNNRSQVVQTKHNFVLLDAYNANPSSMKAAIENFAGMNRRDKIVILGDMLELGDESEKEHKIIINLLKEKGILQAILIGSIFTKVCDDENILTFLSSNEALSYLKKQPITNSSVLVKGSRGMQLEKLEEAL